MLPFGDGTPDRLRGGSRARGSLARAATSLHVPGPPARLAPRVAAWLREQARRACVAAAARHAAALGLRPGRISLRDPRSRWGSCTASGDLMFSWRLIMAPAAVLDYVVAHEVAHLAEMNHSPRFWAVVRGSARTIRRRGTGCGATARALHELDFAAAPA